MHAAGMVEVEAAKAEGRRDAAHASARSAEPSPEFQSALAAAPRAVAAFEAPSRAKRYVILRRLENLGTPRGRTARMASDIEVLDVRTRQGERHAA